MAHLTTSGLPMHGAAPRRHSDPPNLWLTVLAGSVTIHLCVVVALLIAQRFPVRVSNAAIPIDLVEVAASPAPPSIAQQLPNLSSSPNRSAPATAKPPAQSSTSTTAPSRQAATTSQPAVVPSPSLPGSTQGEPSSRGTSRPVTTAPAGRSPAPPTSPSPRSPASPANRGSGNTSTTPGASPPPSTPIATPVPSISPVPSPTSGDGITARVPVNRELSAPARVRTTVEASNKPGALQDMPELPAQVTQRDRDYQSGEFGCVLNPEQQPFFGQSVEVLLTIDEQGRVIPDNTRILTATSSSYDRLVACLLNTWEFVPAANRVNGQPVPVTSNLVVTVIVNPL